MIIELKNTKLLFLYRSKLFYFIKFNTKKESLEDIVYALNIKNKKERINYVYDKGIQIVNKYYEKDLCKFKDGKCIVQQKNNPDSFNGCCRICNLVTNKGCPTVNLACKLVYCKTALQNMKALKLRDIKILKCLSISQRIILKTDVFSTKEEVLKDLYYGIIFYGIRNVFSELKRKINIQKKK